jgi:hypothetical protein
MVTIRLFDLAGAGSNRRFSPYCWHTKLALAHKGLTVEAIPWHFTDKDAIAMSGQGRVPVLLDGDKVVSDSWTIAEYLEDAYPDRPSLIGWRGRSGERQASDVHWEAVDTRFYISSKTFYRANLADAHLAVGDREGYYLENSFRDALIWILRRPHSVMFQVLPDIIGVSATSGDLYRTGGGFRGLRYSFMRRLGARATSRASTS